MCAMWYPKLLETVRARRERDPTSIEISSSDSSSREHLRLQLWFGVLERFFHFVRGLNRREHLLRSWSGGG